MGSPDFSVPCLMALNKSFTVIGVITQPDRPAGRGQALKPPPVKVAAQKLGIPTLQPLRLRTDISAKNQVRQWNPDVIVVAAFGQILPLDILEIPTYGCLNVHASLLPRWRGVTPIQAAILNGDTETGVTIMKMDEGVDTGDIIQQGTIPINDFDTAGSIALALAELGAELMVEALPKYISGDLTPHPQGVSPTPYAPALNRKDGELDFNRPANVLVRQVRAYNPWPGTFMMWAGKPLKIFEAFSADIQSPGVGIFCAHGNYPAVGTSKGLLVITRLQPAGKITMGGDQFLRGAKDW